MVGEKMSRNNKLLLGITAAVLILLLCVCIVFGIYVLYNLQNKGQTVSETPVPSGPITEAKTINSNAIILVEKKVAYCKALAPNDWSFTSVQPYVGADLFSPDRSIHAAWGIAGIYTVLYPTPESALTYLLSMVYSGFNLVGEPQDIGYGYSGYEFNTNIGKQGQVIYKTYNFGTDFYVISVYMAATNYDIWESKGAQALSAAISIRCVSQLRPSTSGLDYGSADPSNESDNPEVDLSEKWSEAILGYENVYSPSTGEHYMAPLNSYWAGGPEGGGYYRELPGGGYEKLSDGLGDY
jgi:hypothetical protein